MGKGRDLKVVGFVSIDGAEAVPLESLTEEQMEYCLDKWCASLSRNMSAYYRQHPEEFALL